MFLPPPEDLDYGWLAKQIIKLFRADSGNSIKLIDLYEVYANVLPVVTGTLARLLYDIQFWMNAILVHQLLYFAMKHISIFR